MIYMYLKKLNMFYLQVLLCKAVAKFSNFCVYENFFINAQQQLAVWDFVWFYFSSILFLQ